MQRTRLGKNEKNEKILCNWKKESEDMERKSEMIKIKRTKEKIKK